MKRLLCAALTAALLLPGAWAVRARAQDDAPPPPSDQGAPPDGGNGGHEAPKHEGRMKERMMKRLGLTDEQAGKLDDARKAHEEASKPLQKQLREGMRKLGQQLKDKASDADIQASLDALKTSHKAMEEENEKFEASLAAFLSPTQRAKLLVGMMMRMRGERGGGERRGPRGGGDGDRRGGDDGQAPDDGGAE